MRRIICVDDEELILNLTVKMCKSISGVDEVKGFSDTNEALLYISENPVDVALLDIDMPGMNGISMAIEIKNRRPDTAIIFLTGYSEYAVEAFRIHASGYLLKPVSKDKLEKEVEYALSRRMQRGKLSEIEVSQSGEKKDSAVYVKTFGEFDVLVDGKVVNFKRAKSKELLAYLVDREGGGVTRAAAFAVLWEGEVYDRNKQKQVDVIVRSLRETLKEYRISEILSIEKGLLRVVPEKFECDLYRFISGDAEVINHYRGEYMNQYYWADITEAYITQQINNGIKI